MRKGNTMAKGWDRFQERSDNRAKDQAAEKAAKPDTPCSGGCGATSKKDVWTCSACSARLKSHHTK